MLILLAVPHVVVVISPLPSNVVPLIFLAVANFEAVEALPLKVALIVLGSFRVASILPSTLTAALIFVLLASMIDIPLAAPHFVVVIADVPLKSVPLIFLAVANFVAVDALPVKFPVILGISAFTL